MTAIASLTLPVPPSVNDLYGRGRNGVVYKKQAARDYEKEVWAICYQAGIHELTASKVSLTIEFYPRGLYDLDNIFKVLFDSLQGTVYVNDRQVRRLKAEMFDPDKRNPRIEITIHKLD